ncbi:MAG: VanZ family protein [Myxococcales bacterium]|nr:VanZ family protein [Myxococcales bacterium]
MSVMSPDDWLPRLLPPPGSIPALDALMIAASTAGLLGLAIGTPWWLSRRDRALSRATVITMLVGLGVTLALQLLAQRPRPEGVVALLPVPPLPSFPSGHAVLAGIAVVMLATHRRGLILLAVPTAALIAVSRVHVGHHHLSDVLGGGLLGLGLALGAVTRARAAADDPWRLRWLLWPQLGLVLAITLVAYTGAFAHGGAAWLRLPGMDKALHFLLFGLLALGTCFATRDRALVLGRGRIPLAVLLPLLGALAEELAQALSPHRTADPLDLMADLLGMLAFWWLGRCMASTMSVSALRDPRLSHEAHDVRSKPASPT